MSATRCPTEQQLAALVEGELEGPDLEQVTAHVDRCPTCMDAVATLARLREDPEPAVPDALRAAVVTPQPVHGGRRPLRAIPALAAAAVLVLAVSWWQGGPPPATSPAPSVPPAHPDAVRGTVRPAVVLEKPEDGSSVAGGFDIRWSGPPEVAFYEIQVTTPGGDVVWQRQVDGGTLEVVVPASAVRGATLYVWVSALVPEGRRINSNVVRVETLQRD